MPSISIKLYYTIRLENERLPKCVTETCTLDKIFVITIAIGYRYRKRGHVYGNSERIEAIVVQSEYMYVVVE